MFLFRPVVWVFAALACAFSSSSQAAEVVVFSPQGEIKGVRQVRAQFSEPMIPFGDPRAGETSPFTWSCSGPSPQAQARWADPKNWILDFQRDLVAGVSCRFELRADAKTLQGAAIGGTRVFEFTTGAPAIDAIQPYPDTQIAEDQAFIIKFDGAVAPSAFEKSLFLIVEGMDEKVPLTPVEPALRDSILKARFASRGYDLKQLEDRAVVRGRTNLPPGKAVKLVWLPEKSRTAAPAAAPTEKTGIRDRLKGMLKRWKDQAAEGPAVNPEGQSFDYRVRQPFRATFTCERENAESPCLPITPLVLTFSSSVDWKLLSGARIEGVGGGGSFKPKQPEEAAAKSGKSAVLVEQLVFEPPFPENRKFRLVLPSGLQDDAGRTLDNAATFPLEIATGRLPPLAKFSANFGIIESRPEAVVPLTLRQVEGSLSGGLVEIPGSVARMEGSSLKSILEMMNHAGQQDGWESRQKSVITSIPGLSPKKFTAKKANPEAAFEVIGVPLPGPGFYLLEVKSPRLGAALNENKKPVFVSTAVLATNLGVHLKRSREDSLVWVTELDSARPVGDAEVVLMDCSGNELARGQTNREGIWKGPVLNMAKAYCDNPSGRGVYAFAKKGEDFSFVNSDWDGGIERWRFNMPGEHSSEENGAHTVLARTLLRAGETVQMKHFFRRRALAGLVEPKAGELPGYVILRHQGSGQMYSQPISWDKSRTAVSELALPKDARLGSYAVYLGVRDKPTGGDEDEGGYLDSSYQRSGSFQVAEFRVPVMKGQVKLVGQPLLSGDVERAQAELAVRYLSGGGASGLPVTVRYQMEPTSIRFAEFEDYEFANGPARAPSPSLGYSYDEEEDSLESDEVQGDTSSPGKSKKISQISLSLDGGGSGTVRLTGLSKPSEPSLLRVEMEYRDPNGEIQSSSNRSVVYPSRALVGVKPDSWASSQGTVKFRIAVADERGRPRAGASVEAQLYRSEVLSYRKRLLGGFYAYENQSELKKLSGSCSGKSSEQGTLLCEIQTDEIGKLVLEARVRDSEGRESIAHAETHVYSKDDWWGASDSDRIDLIPERKHYEPGETARIRVRMPFASATALVTLEREGIARSFVREVRRESPEIEVPVTAQDAPNIFASALLVRGRAADVRPTALVDLGKPAYKMGITELLVGWKPHELQVSVSPEREEFRIREKAKVRIRVARADGSKFSEAPEVAIAAVDDGLLELKPNDSWKLLEAMMGLRGLSVDTATAQMQVIGKRHFGLKARPLGGDGGSSSARELFDSLLLWKGRVPLDSSGSAEVEIPLNDSLSSFSIVAIAHEGLSHFGTGRSSIRTTQDLSIFAGVPPMGREGDRFHPTFTVRNSTGAPLTAEVSGRVILPTGGKKIELGKKPVTLAAGQSQNVSFDFVIPDEVRELRYEARVVASGGGAAGAKPIEDKIVVRQVVAPGVPVRIFQATLSQLDGRMSLPVALPKDAKPGKGGVRVLLDSTLTSSLDGVRRYMTDYPYTCLEQKVSRAIVLEDDAAWKSIRSEMPLYLDGNGLLKYFPDSRIEGSDTLTAYVLAASTESGRELDDSLREKVVGAMKRFVRGELRIRDRLSFADLTLRRIFAAEAVALEGELEWKDLASLEVTPRLWPTSAVLAWRRILQRVDEVPGRAKHLAEADQILRSRLNFQGTVMTFSDEKIDSFWWLMLSSDGNFNRLILSLLDDSNDGPWNQSWQQDLPRLMRGSIQRMHQGHWYSTVANTWGALAVRAFGGRFESTPVQGSTQGGLAAEKRAFGWKSSRGQLDFSWPAEQQTLTIEHSGSGKPWATVQSLAALPLREPFSSGYRVEKSISKVSGSGGSGFKKGDVLKVHLDLEAQSDMSWVVVDDPVPAGSTVLGSGLGNDSEFATQSNQSRGWVWPAYEERGFGGYRVYYQYVPKGKWSVEYSVRLNEDGEFVLPNTRVEAMYAPEMLGEIPNATFQISK